MKTIRTLLAFLFFMAVIGLVGIFIFVEFNGKKFIEQGLSRKLNRPVSVSSVRLVFPIGLRIDDLLVKGVLKADEARIILGTDFMFRREPALARVIIRHPEFALMKTKDAALSICMASATAPAEQEPLPVSSAAHPGPEAASVPANRYRIYIDELTIEDGRVEYFDFSQSKPVQFDLEKVQLKARDIAYPIRSVKTKFSLVALLQGKKIPLSGSTIDAKGWIDLAARDMQATLDIIEPGGKMGLSSVLEAVNNDLLIRGKVDLSGSLSPKPSSTPDPSGSMDQMLIGALGNSGISFTANFSVKTKLDDIQISTIAFGGEVGTGSSGSLKENLKNIGKQFEAIGKKLTEPAVVLEPVSVNAVVPVPQQ